MRFYHMCFRETGELLLTEVIWLLDEMEEFNKNELGSTSEPIDPDNMTAAEKIEMYKQQGKIS